MRNTHVTRVGRTAAMASLAVVAASGALVGTASSASAAPTGCYVTVVKSGIYTNAESRCTGGTGEHRAVIRQWHFQFGEFECVGNWVPAYAVSTAFCGIDQVVSARVETRW